ncbi:elmo domain-containing protein a-like [Trifolium pratense]|uniref:Elmo domain-containing protein a-like n=1 Tax=Trifolium pratense TaxID=57577 RepID=A0A2K3P3A9_TRIPR|nr:elmo domain-containing protein a-like [Trifolium pratense]
MRNSGDWLYADDTTCGSPHWIGKGLTCVCFKPKGGNCQPICITLTPLQGGFAEVTWEMFLYCFSSAVFRSGFGLE